MHPSTLSRRKFLTLSGAAAATGLFARFGRAAACPIRDYIDEFTRMRNLGDAINAFAVDLHARLAKGEKGNLFFSPFSIETALAMTSARARGETLAEMQKTLHLPSDPHASFGELIRHLNGKPRFQLPQLPPRVPGIAVLPNPDPPIRPLTRGYELSVANAIWAMKDYPWRKEFLDLTRKHYGSGLIEVDFAKSDAARKQINDWVEKETKHKIKDLIPDGVLNALTRMVLTNAIYFKGTWQYTFDKKHTVDAPFTGADGVKADVPMMHRTAEFNYGVTHMGGRAGQTVQVLELPYSGHELSMLIYLPEKPTGANRLAGLLTKDDIGAPKLKEKTVHVYLPRFKAETSYLLNKPLIDLGMKAAFTRADFSGMHTSPEYLSISHVLHKAFVEVNEEGTEAAAATAVVIATASAIVEPEPVFRADRPFVFVIRDNTSGTALFMGRYNGPMG